MTGVVLVLVAIQLFSVLPYCAVAFLAWSRKDGPAWWAFRVTVTFEALRAFVGLAFLFQRGSALVPKWDLMIVASVMCSVGAGLGLWWMAMAMTEHRDRVRRRRRKGAR